jgi:hypothetical protein
MPSLLLTFFVGLLGLTAIAFGFLYGQDFSKNKPLKWYEVLKTDLTVRIIFWVVGLALLAWGGYFQFSHFSK